MFGITRSIVMYYCYCYCKMYSRLLVTSWRSSGKSRLQEVTKMIYSNTLRMLCAVHISMFLLSSMANGKSNPCLIIPSAPNITCKIFVLSFHILLTYFCRSFYLLIFSVSFVLTFESAGSVGKSSLYYYYYYFIIIKA